MEGSKSTRPTLEVIAVACGQFVFRYRDYLAPAALLLTVIGTRPHPFLGDPAADTWLNVAGILVALLGQTLRVLVIGLAYIRRGGRNKTITADHLVCDGLFAHSRNPLYLGNFLLLTGLVMVWNAPLAYVLVLPTIGLALFSVVLAEEAYLRERFGSEYEAYCARVNRFIPNFRDFGQTMSAFSFDWKKVIRKEYGTTFAWPSIALALIAVERVRWNGWSASRESLCWVAFAWAGLALMWGVGRWLKKTKRLESRRPIDAD
jgi:protein-S-isoprenylcysteine O-methyltransferase Ste14